MSCFSSAISAAEFLAHADPDFRVEAHPEVAALDLDVLGGLMETGLVTHDGVGASKRR